MKFEDKIKLLKRPLILDGATGSLLEQKGFSSNDILWSANALINFPEEVLNIHLEYLKAGADIITTNTFRTNPFAFESVGRNDFHLYVDKAVTICKNAAKNFNDIIIAGSNPPAEDCYKIERTISKEKLFNNHKRHIDRLIFNNVDLILNETFSHSDEIEFVCEYCSTNDFPFIISLYFDSNLQILSGERIEEVVDSVIKYNPLAVGFNCISENTFDKLNESVFNKYKFGYYLNCGKINLSGNFVCDISSDKYYDLIQKKKSTNLVFVGSCCGSNPDYTKVIKKALNEIYLS